MNGRMATREDQAQSLVAHIVFLLVLRGLLLEQFQGDAMTFVAARFAPQVVECPVASGGDDPSCGRRRHSIVRPPRERGDERVLDRFLGETDVAEKAHEDRNRTTMLAPEDRFDRRGQCCSWNGRTSIGVPMARASLRPQASAASRSGALSRVMPPICSLLSMNGPSVVITSLPW